MKRKKGPLPGTSDEKALTSLLFASDHKSLWADSDDENKTQSSVEFPTPAQKSEKEAERHEPLAKTESAWFDEDDDSVELNLQSVDRLKKLQRSGGSEVVSGRELGDLLRERFDGGRSLDWAKTDAGSSSSRHNAAGTVATSGSADDPLLNSTTPLVIPKFHGENSREGARLPLSEGKIDIERLVDANIAAPAGDGGVGSVHFHSSSSLIMVAGRDKVLSFFQTDGDKNQKEQSFFSRDYSAANARWLGQGSEVVIGPRKPFFATYDAISGSSQQVSTLQRRGLKSHERMAVSPLGSLIAFGGAGGYIHLVSGSNKTWVQDIKMNTACRAIKFVNETTLISSGLDADVYVWDVRQGGRCMCRFQNQDGTPTSALAAVAAPG